MAWTACGYMNFNNLKWFAAKHSCYHYPHYHLHCNSNFDLGLAQRRRCSTRIFFSLGDRLLDYIEGGPKLRKWYGAPKRRKKEKQTEDDGIPDGEEEIAPESGNAVLVTDGDSEIGKLVILSLIMKRIQIKVLVKDAEAAVRAFGSYIEAIPGDIVDKASVSRALKGVFAVICTNKMGVLLEAENLNGVEHIVFLSQLAFLRGHAGIQALLNNKARSLAEEDEKAVIESGIPYTVVRTGKLDDNPGGRGFNFKMGCARNGSISREDAAVVCVEALESRPERGLIFEVANGEGAVENWKDQFAALSKTATGE